MNIEDSQDKNVSMTIGQRLRQAREQRGLTQQAVAERLCLKITTIRDIEDDNISTDLTSTFTRGYIRSYGKLFNLPEEDLLPMLDDTISGHVANVVKMQSFSLGKRRKKRDSWLMRFTWLVVAVVLGLTGVWWWQTYRAQQEEIATMAVESSAQLFPQNTERSIPLTDIHEGKGKSAPLITPDINDPSAIPVAPPSTVIAAPTETTTSVSEKVNTVEPLPPAIETNALVMSFSADCWVQVIDASGKLLVSGIKKSGDQLSLIGKPPYKLTIGAPAAVTLLEFQGKQINLSEFTRSNRIARLTVPSR